MPGFLRAATIVLTSTAAIGVGVLTMLPSVPEGPWSGRARAAGVPVAELPRASCKQQLWPNTDRICQSWTIANPEVAKLLSAPTAPAPAPSAQTRLWSAAAVSESATGAVQADRSQSDDVDAPTPIKPVPQVAAAPAPRAVHEGKSALAVLSGPDAQHEIAVTARSGDGSRRVIMIRPTSRQDQLYYSVHRDLVATAVSTLRQ
jgi:hypothetical protein